MLEGCALRRFHLRPINFALRLGECVSIGGKSGAGKSMLLRMIADLDPHEGDALLDGAVCRHRNGGWSLRNLSQSIYFIFDLFFAGCECRSDARTILDRSQFRIKSAALLKSHCYPHTRGNRDCTQYNVDQASRPRHSPSVLKGHRPASSQAIACAAPPH